MPNQTRNSNHESEYNGYNPFSNSHHENQQQILRRSTLEPTSNFRVENFYRNANFILTLFLSGVALASLVLFSTVKRHNIAASQKLYENLESNISLNGHNSIKIVNDVYKIANEMSNTTTVLGVQNIASSTLNSNLVWSGTSNLVKGDSNKIIISKLGGIISESDPRAIYIKKSNLYNIESSTLFELPNEWVVLPFDYNGVVEFYLLPNFEGSFLLNIFSKDDEEAINQNISGDLGYLELNAK